MTAVNMVAVIAAAAGRLNKPIARNPAPTACVAAAESVQNGAGPGRNPKELLDDVGAEAVHHVVDAVVSSAHLRESSICKARRSFTFPHAAPVHDNVADRVQKYSPNSPPVRSTVAHEPARRSEPFSGPRCAAARAAGLPWRRGGRLAVSDAPFSMRKVVRRSRPSIW